MLEDALFRGVDWFMHQILSSLLRTCKYTQEINTWNSFDAESAGCSGSYTTETTSLQQRTDRMRMHRLTGN